MSLQKDKNSIHEDISGKRQDGLRQKELEEV